MSRDSRYYPVQSNTETPMVKGQPRGTSTRGAESLLTKSPSTEAPIYRFHATCTPPNIWGPRCHVSFGNSRIANPSCTVPCCWKTPNAGIPIPRIRATCPRSDRRSRSNRGIALRDSDVHGIIALANPDPPIRNEESPLRA
jgi:hypothetical protein